MIWIIKSLNFNLLSITYLDCKEYNDEWENRFCNKRGKMTNSNDGEWYEGKYYENGCKFKKLIIIF